MENTIAPEIEEWFDQEIIRWERKLDRALTCDEKQAIVDAFGGRGYKEEIAARSILMRMALEIARRKKPA